MKKEIKNLIKEMKLDCSVEEFENKVNWGCISVYQKLSEPFIREYEGRVNWEYISKYQKLSEPFIKEYKDKLNIDKENNTLYWTFEQKLNLIKKYPQYKIDGDSIIAYKGIRSDRYSTFNFQYKYEKGGVYESHCDCNMKEGNSFGFSAWTEEEAREYCNQNIIKVHININDIGAIVHDGGKIRCWKFEVSD